MSNHTTRVGFLAFPGVLQLDLTGAYGFLAAGPGVQPLCVWKDTRPFPSSDGLWLTPTATLENCPPLDVLVVPGGGGADSLLLDETVIGFIRSQAAKARYVASVCTGALLLGAAGLLAGRRATTHWMSLGLLAQFRAIPVKQRVVLDGKYITGAGVSSGIDLGLVLAGLLWGEDEAMRIQLAMEYAPFPPHAAGSPETAPARVVVRQVALTAERQKKRAEAVAAAALRLPA